MAALFMLLNPTLSTGTGCSFKYKVDANQETKGRAVSTLRVLVLRVGGFHSDRWSKIHGGLYGGVQY